MKKNGNGLVETFFVAHRNRMNGKSIESRVDNLTQAFAIYWWTYFAAFIATCPPLAGIAFLTCRWWTNAPWIVQALFLAIVLIAVCLVVQKIFGLLRDLVPLSSEGCDVHDRWTHLMVDLDTFDLNVRHFDNIHSREEIERIIRSAEVREIHQLYFGEARTRGLAENCREAAVLVLGFCHD